VDLIELLRARAHQLGRPARPGRSHTPRSSSS
jgi:hypothetical protein